MKKIEEKILMTVEKYGMLSVGETVVVAVSGGADSMCLLHFFNKFSSNWNLNIICAHVNHGIRGEEADNDEAFVRRFCKNNGIRFVSKHFDVPAVSKETGESLEMCGRRLRYEFFSEVSSNAKIATAHNLNDSAETFLLNLSRGTGLSGLTGIAPVRGNIIRPLSSCTRDEIESYLSNENITYVTDSTNLTDDYSRNKIRHNVIPVLNELNPAFFSVFSGCISSLNDADDYIRKVTDKAFFENKNTMGFDVSGIMELDKAVRDRLLIKIARFYGAHDITFNHISIIGGFLATGGALMLPGKMLIVSDSKNLYRAEDVPAEPAISEQYRHEKNIYNFPGCVLSVESVDKCCFENYNMKLPGSVWYMDADKISGSIFRNRLPGDRFRFPNALHSKSLKNLYKEKGISVSDRWGVPLLAKDGNILWIDGVGVSSYAAIDEKTEKIIKIIKL